MLDIFGEVVTMSKRVFALYAAVTVGSVTGIKWVHGSTGHRNPHHHWDKFGVLQYWLQNKAKNFMQCLPW